MTTLEILFKSNTLIKAKYDFTVSQNRVLQKVFYEIQKNKINVAEIDLDDMKKLIKHKDYNTVEGIKEFLKNIKENEIMQFQSIILMLMYIDRIDVQTILEWLCIFSYAFKEPIATCLNNYESGAYEALEDLK